MRRQACSSNFPLGSEEARLYLGLEIECMYVAQTIIATDSTRSVGAGPAACLTAPPRLSRCSVDGNSV
eukprot:CAMPEP_0202826954 /NCGR_PEP_ID=MMETSP1389-20130828/13949_1 /ASSEMBLY_ACC=CAM_ASM_000865 /TAXON_ID=302021 /ORGANISM="Rhodomonas sp., Strain CCMP768" /LENGTH=67 /DNA_ID=CAMNT_0049500299 /DNA_START=89 /DNA_END=292 /DNA_ORIENTATION=-